MKIEYECGQCGFKVPDPSAYNWLCPRCNGQLYGSAPSVNTRQVYSDAASFNIDRESPKEIAKKNWRHKEKCGGKWTNPDVKKCMERAIEQMPDHEVASKFLPKEAG